MSNILKIPILYAGSVTLVCRFVDAFTDIFFGTLGDRTHTRLGSFRPWYITMAIPACLSFLMLFICPGFVTPGSAVALFWIYLIYLIYGSIFTTIMYTPYSAFTSVATDDDNERRNLVLARQVGLNISGLVVALATPVMMYFGGGVSNNEAAFRALGIFVAVISAVCYLLCGLSIRERVTLNAGKSLPLKEGFRVFKGNRIFLGALICNVLHSIGIAMFGGMMSYYFLYYKVNPALMSKSQLAAAIVATILSLVVLPALMKRLPRIAVYWIGVAAPGTVNTILTFIQKITTGFGTMLTSVLLSAVGYEATLGFQQTPKAQEGIRLVTCIVPALFFLVSAAGLFFLRLKAKEMHKIRQELAQKHLAGVEK